MLLPFLPFFFSIVKPEIITLTSENHVSITGPINAYSQSKFINDIENIHGKYIFIYISSTGGNVIHGENIIQYMQYKKAQKKRLLCIADKAYSMAFHIFQHCTHRYILPSSSIMQHQMHLTFEGELSKVQNYINYIDKINTRFINLESKRLKILPKEYKSKITNEWWLYGKEIIESRTADMMLDAVGCHHSLFKENKHMSIDTNVVIVSKCPLI